MSFDLERLYRLLPAVFRIRDARLAGRALTEADMEEIKRLKQDLESLREKPDVAREEEIHRRLDELQRGPLKAVLSVLAEQIAVLEEDLEQLYDDQFIETCAEWVVPYIGDLVGSSDLFTFPQARVSRRADVANTLAYRRRKGTAAVLEQLGHDVTAWDARVVEFFRLLAVTQYLNHLRPGCSSWTDVRPSMLLERLNGPFDYAAHAADVRRMESGRGRHNIPNVGVYLWRLNSYSVTDGPAVRHPANGRCYRFDALGRDVPLHVRPETEDEITDLAEMVNVPMRISRYMLKLRPEDYYGRNKRDQVKSLLVYADGKEIPLMTPLSPPGTEEPYVVSANLSDIRDQNGNWTWANLPEDKVAIDPELGRIAFPSKTNAPKQVRVIYHYGFSTDVGGGEYSRAGLSRAEGGFAPAPVPADHTQLVQEIGSAGAEAIIQVTTNGRIDGDLAIALQPQQRLTIQAENGKCPVLNGSITLTAGRDAQVTVDGLWIAGAVTVAGEAPMSLTLRHCTLFAERGQESVSPPAPRSVDAICWHDPEAGGTLFLDHVISGPVRLGPEVAIEVADSIVDARGDDSLALGGPDAAASAGPATIVRSTIAGVTKLREIVLAENSLFTGRVTSARRQHGCVRFCYLPPGSSVPRPYRCQPQQAVRDAIKDAKRQKGDSSLSQQEEDSIARDVRIRVQPCFTSRTCGRPEYMQLHASCPVEIRAGGDDEAEMGVFHDLYQPQRRANLRIRLNEYLRFGLEAGIIDAS